MATKHMPRFALGGLLFAALTSSATSAHADKVTSVGVFGGAHVFSNRNELGVADETVSSKFTSLKNAPIVGARFSLLFTNWVGFELEGGFIPTKSRTSATQTTEAKVSALAYRAHLLVELWQAPMQHAIPFLVFGGGFTTVLSSDNEAIISKDTDENLYFGAGLKLKTDGGLGVRFDVRALFPPSNESTFATMDLEATVGLFKEFGVRTRVMKEEPVDDVQPTVGDADGDGLMDPDDSCVNDPEDMDGFEDTDGCPDLDDDNDGVADTSDECKNDPEDADGYSDEDGCPDPDNDGDGIPDTTDQCKMDPEDADGYQDEDGCPDPDNDGDGVLDGADECPDQLESANGYKDSDGCPDDVPKAVQQFTVVIMGITFKNDSDQILKSSFKLLDKAVKVLKDYPELRMEIQGHTDDTGEEGHNRTLSQMRADAVKAYFESKGVDATRIEAKGYGWDVPIAKGKSKAARAKNRRVEFKLITTIGTPTPPAEPVESTENP
jgi:OOP family OmpA-OmpF porin